MKKIFVSLFLFLSACSFAQETSTQVNSGIFIGLTFSPDYSYRWLQAGSDIGFIKNYRDSTEIPKIGFTTGFIFLYKKKRLTFEGGMKFSDKGEKTKNVELYNNNEDPALPSNTIKTTYHLYYLDFPVKFNYIFFTNNKINAFISAGMSFNLFLYERDIIKFIGTDQSGTSKGFGDELSKINFACQAGAGIDYDINKLFNLRFEPVFRSSIIPIADAPIKQYQYSIGVNFGLLYKLK